jgi:hypothetical protein
VSQLTPAQRAAITININVDMLSSSNGVYFVQDGDGAHTVPPGPVRPGRSAELEHVLTSYLESQGLPWVARPYDRPLPRYPDQATKPPTMAPYAMWASTVTNGVWRP